MWYLTYYEEYPIYEPAEGGYYYAGVSEGQRYAYKTLNEAMADVPRLAEELMLEPFTHPDNVDEWFILAHYGYKYVAMYRDRYIGEDRYLVLETSAKVGGLECGWHPYE